MTTAEFTKRWNGLGVAFKSLNEDVEKISVVSVEYGLQNKNAVLEALGNALASFTTWFNTEKMLFEDEHQVELKANPLSFVPKTVPVKTGAGGKSIVKVESNLESENKEEKGVVKEMYKSFTDLAKKDEESK